MGLFGGTKIYVGSTVYNLAGDEEDRPNYLKTAVVGGILTDTKFSMSDTLQSAYMHGPGTSARSFYRWAEKHYDKIGVPPMKIRAVTPYTESDVVAQLPVDAGQTAVITKTDNGGADIIHWAERFILDNYPARFDTDWDLDWDGTTVTVTFLSDELTDSFDASDPEFDIEAQYFYVYYDRQDSGGAVVGKSLWIYKVGDGFGTLDDAVTEDVKATGFWPFIPVRYENQFFSESYHPDIYELSKKAYKKATGQKYDDLIDKIKDNDSLEDIDHAYVVYGVPLNVLDNSARKYLFRFFKALIADTPGESTTNYLQIKSPGAAYAQLNMEISWESLTLTSGDGLKKSDAKVGEVWLTKVDGRTGPGGLPLEPGDVFIHCQVTKDHWETLSLTKLKHKNLIYKTKAVTTIGSDALDDADESGFLVPLHYETVREMSAVDSTQMMTAATFIVFNSYVKVKQKWYQTGIFKIIVFIAIIALTIVFAPAGALAGAAFIGGALGLSGLLAVVAGMVIIQLVTMLLQKLLTALGTAVFGEKFGAIFGAVATFLVMSIGTPMLGGASIASSWGNMMSAQNLLGLTSAVGSGISGYMQASTQGIVQDTKKVMDNYNKESKHISELFDQTFGYGSGVIDPLSLTDSPVGNFFETESQFLLRTLMTGSDIAELSTGMLTNFSDLTLTTALPHSS